MIGELSAASGCKHREPRVDEVAGLGAGARGVERGVLQQPDKLWCVAGGDVRGPLFHGLDGVLIGHRRVRDPPLGGRAGAGKKRRQSKVFAALLEHINHWVTIFVLICVPSFMCGCQIKVATLDNVSVDLMVVLGTTSMPVHQVMRLSRGAIIELDATEQDEVKVLANNLPIASGVVVVNRNRIAVEVKQMLPRIPDRR